MAFFDDEADYLPSINSRSRSQNSGFRSKPNITYIDDIVPQRSSDVHDIWRDDKKSKQAGAQSRKFQSYRFKNRPTSSGSSSSSISSSAIDKDGEVKARRLQILNSLRVKRSLDKKWWIS